MRIQAILVALIIVPFALPAAAEGEAYHWEGPGYIALLVAPGPDGWLEAEAIFYGVGERSEAGVVLAEATDPDNAAPNFGAGMDPVDHVVRVTAPGLGTKEVRVEREAGKHTAGAYEYWLLDAMYFVFYAAGNVDRFEVKVLRGELLGVAKGPDAYAGWHEDLEGAEAEVTVRAPGVGRYAARTKETVSFETDRPFYAELRVPQIVFAPVSHVILPRPPSTSNVELSGPTGTYSCPCWATPGQTSGGTWTISSEGLSQEGLLYWAVAPELPTLPT